MKKVIQILFIGVVLATVLFTALFYKADVPPEELIKKTTYPESNFLYAAGLQVHYRMTGPQDAPVLLLLHGVASSLHTWDGWHQELSEDFRVISIDVPGFGLTGPFENGDYSIEHYMQALDEIVVALGVKKALVAGNSYGGYLAWNYALYKPEKVEKLLLMDAAGVKDLVKQRWQDMNIGMMISGAPILKYVSWVATPKFLVRKSIENVYADTSLVSDELVDRYYSMITRAGNRKAFSAIVNRAGNGEENMKRMSKITQPTLVMWGEQDKVHPLAESELFLKAIPGSVSKLYPNLGHVPMEENPVVTAQDAKQFFLQ